MFKKILSITKNKYTECPECNGNIIYGSISCPDQKQGCCVAHYGYCCEDCKSVFDIKAEYNQTNTDLQTFEEKIGIGIINSKAINKLGIIK